MVALNVWVYSLYSLGAVTSYCILTAVLWGIWYKRHHHRPTAWLDEHRSHVRWTSVLLVLLVTDVVVGEIFVLPAKHLSPFVFPLGKIHITCALIFGSLFCLAKFKVTGTSYPRAHRFVAYPCIFFYAAALITGFFLLAPLLK